MFKADKRGRLTAASYMYLTFSHQYSRPGLFRDIISVGALITTFTYLQSSHGAARLNLAVSCPITTIYFSFLPAQFANDLKPYHTSQRAEIALRPSAARLLHSALEANKMTFDRWEKGVKMSHELMGEISHTKYSYTSLAHRDVAAASVALGDRGLRFVLIKQQLPRPTAGDPELHVNYVL